MSQQILWGNSLVKVDNSMLFNYAAWDRGLVAVADLYSGNNLMTYPELVNKFGQVMTWFEYAQLIDAIPILWRQSIHAQGPICIIRGANLNKSMGVTARNVYTDLIANLERMKPKIEKWSRVLSESIELEQFQKHLEAIYKVTIATKFRNFQYSLMMHSVVTNRNLYIWKKREDDLCSFCKNHVENYTHLFYECSQIRPIWEKFHELFDVPLNPLIEIDIYNVMFNCIHPTLGSVFNFIVLIIKQYIYRSWCIGNIPRIVQIKNEVESVYKVEESLAFQTHKYNSHVRKWKPIKPYLSLENPFNYIHEYNTNL